MSAWTAARRLLRRPPQELVTALRVEQDGAALVVDFTLSDGLTPHALWSLRSDTLVWHRLADVADGGPTRIDLAAVAGDEPAQDSLATAAVAVEVTATLPSAHPTIGVLAEIPGAEVTSARGQTTVRCRIELASSHTPVPQFTSVGPLTPYLSGLGVLSVAVERPTAPYGAVYVDVIRGRGGVLRLRGRINGRHSVIRGGALVLRARTSGRELSAPMSITPDARRSTRAFGARWYRYRTQCEWSQLWVDGEPDNDIYDAWAVLAIEGEAEPLRARIGLTRLHVRMLTRPSWAHGETGAAAITPYYTFKAKRTSFQVDVFERETADYLRRQVRLRHVNRLRHRASTASGGKPIWLVGERPYKAQDTGLAMFRHLREHHPEIDAHYVIDKHSAEYANVAPYGNVVEHRSKEHVRLSLLADRVLGSHHPDFTYPLRTTRFRRAVRATRVFLQHGVMGTKWMVPNYGKGQGDFATDLFIASSRREKEYLVSDFGWASDQVAVTGLTRFDSLFAGDVPVLRQLLVMPTWRDWLQDGELYLESDYHARWSSLLHDERLADLAERYGFEIVFCLHPNMQVFTPLFTDAPVRVISQGEVDVQRLLKESAMLLTDYSSVGFDFAFLDRPVVYYQFDRDKFLGPRGSHIDLDLELPGTVVRTHDATLHALEELGKDDFAMQPGMRERADRFIDHRDRNNSERVYEVTAAARRRRPRVSDIVAAGLPAAGIRFWRRSRIYTPMMRRLLRILQKFPADPNRVVFESGVGRQYADSPRYIYEELVRRGSTMRKVWVYDQKIHTSDESTQVVERLSPGYYWHLGRAKYWVSNQNLPHYVTRRRDGVYVQTWHGTPLKRMLLDIDEVQGRDDGYVGRMLRAASQWSVLVSPSRFASETIARAYGYGGDVLEVGYPRNDILARPESAELARVVRMRLGISPDARVLLYAPTFRDDQGSGSKGFGFKLPFDLMRMAERLGPDTVLLLRMHLVVRGRIEIPPELEGRVLDGSKYPDIQELFLASDALITDYSSVFFDYATLRRPMVFYAYDLENYRDNLRGFYLDYLTEMPGPIVTSEDDLLAALDDLDGVLAAYADRYDAFLARFAPNDDGHAAERVVDAVFGTVPSG